MDETNSYPTMILIRGLPGSGKSFVAQELQKVLGFQKVIMLDPDTIDFGSNDYLEHTNALSKEGVDEALHAYRFLRAKAYKGIADHKIIVWNQPFTNIEIFNKMVANFQIQADLNNTILKILVVEVIIDENIANERVQNRKRAGGHGPSSATFNRFVSDYKTVSTYGYNTVTVKGGGEVSDSVSLILAALEKLV